MRCGVLLCLLHRQHIAQLLKRLSKCVEVLGGDDQVMCACRGAVFLCGSMVCEFFEEDGVVEIQDVVWAEVGEGALAALDVFEHQGDVRRDGLGQGVEKVPQVLKRRAHVHGGQYGRLVEVPGARAC